MWKNSLKNVESDNNKILYETLLDFLQRNGTYFLNKPHIYIYIYMHVCVIKQTTECTVQRQNKKRLRNQNQSFYGRSFGKSNIKHCTIACRIELDTGAGTTENAVEFDSTLDRQHIRNGHSGTQALDIFQVLKPCNKYRLLSNYRFFAN